MRELSYIWRKGLRWRRRHRLRQLTPHSVTKDHHELMRSRTGASSSWTCSGQSSDLVVPSHLCRATPRTGRWCRAGRGRRSDAVRGARRGWDSGAVPDDPRSDPERRPPSRPRWRRTAAVSGETASDCGPLRCRSTSLELCTLSSHQLTAVTSNSRQYQTPVGLVYDRCLVNRTTFVMRLKYVSDSANVRLTKCLIIDNFCPTV